MIKRTRHKRLQVPEQLRSAGLSLKYYKRHMKPHNCIYTPPKTIDELIQATRNDPINNRILTIVLERLYPLNMTDDLVFMFASDCLISFSVNSLFLVRQEGTENLKEDAVKAGVDSKLMLYHTAIQEGLEKWPPILLQALQSYKEEINKVRKEDTEEAVKAYRELKDYQDQTLKKILDSFSRHGVQFDQPVTMKELKKDKGKFIEQVKRAKGILVSTNKNDTANAVARYLNIKAGTFTDMRKHHKIHYDPKEKLFIDTETGEKF